jgi:hypothetical protein
MQSRLEELEFNYETLRFMKESGTSDEQTREVLVTETNLDSNLVTLLLSLKSTFFRAVLLRYKLCAEKKVSQEGVEKNLGNFRFKFRLVTDHLFSSETKEVPVELEEMEEEVVENKVELAEEEVDEVVEAEENVFARFVKARVKKTGNKKDKVKSSQFYTTFREWYEEHFEEEGVPSKKELKAFLNDNLGASTKNVWNGVSLD